MTQDPSEVALATACSCVADLSDKDLRALLIIVKEATIIRSIEAASAEIESIGKRIELRTEHDAQLREVLAGCHQDLIDAIEEYYHV
jgi:hypothetical protein